MAQPAIVQSAFQASAAPAPANFTGNFGGNTAAGTTLLAVAVAALSGAPVISTPTNWTALNDLSTDQGTALALRVYAYPNNPGGFTAVTWSTLTNVNGIATALFEVSGMPAILSRSGSGVVTTATSGAKNTPDLAVGATNAFYLLVGACLTSSAFSAPNLVGSLAPNAVLVVGAGGLSSGPLGDSAGGATNARLRTFTLTCGPDQPNDGLSQFAATYGAASANITVGLVLASTNSQPRARVWNAGAEALAVSGYAGSSGGW